MPVGARWAEGRATPRSGALASARRASRSRRSGGPHRHSPAGGPHSRSTHSGVGASSLIGTQSTASSDGGGSGGQIPQGIRDEFGLGQDGQPLGRTPSGGWPAPPPAPDPGPAGSNGPGTVPPAPEPGQAGPAPAQAGADKSGSAPP